jgi:hypothetical protein
MLRGLSPIRSSQQSTRNLLIPAFLATRAHQSNQGIFNPITKSQQDAIPSQTPRLKKSFLVLEIQQFNSHFSRPISFTKKTELVHVVQHPLRNYFRSNGFE